MQPYLCELRVKTLIEFDARPLGAELFKSDPTLLWIGGNGVVLVSCNVALKNLPLFQVVLLFYLGLLYLG